ncbi:MAG: ABC transporter ATP-binding protein [Lachnospiraceae bacterium]|nr:ABC transporter ATP-binding protein [Lachnospiraceae bacterium]
MSEKIMINGEGITRSFPVPGGEFQALKGINLKIGEGVFAILKGRSGSGKTTLMNILSTLDDPTEGEVYLDDERVRDLSQRARENLRRRKMGFVFQSVSLIPSLNAYQNVEFALRMAGGRINKQSAYRVEECLKKVGLGNRMTHMPSEMSGGEQQRVAIARAFVHRPSIIFADEPTAELDSAMAARVTETFKRMSREENITVLMTTHDVGLMGAADEIIELESGERIS